MRDFFIHYVDAVVQRRSYYLLEDRAVVDDSHVVKLVDELLMVMPSPFNVQSARVVLLLGEHHRQLWQFVAEALYPLISEERFQATKRKIELSFASGHGTLLFYEDVAALNKLREHYPAYANNVDVWSEQSSGMLQFAMWTGLEAMGYGASLQHYGNLIHHAVALGGAALADAVDTGDGCLYGNVLVVVRLVHEEPVDAEIVEVDLTRRIPFEGHLAEFLFELFQFSLEPPRDLPPCLHDPAHLLAFLFQLVDVRTSGKRNAVKAAAGDDDAVLVNSTYRTSHNVSHLMDNCLE
jgi:predicted oxidoreductase (fatty acid repression mutant protein)